MTHNPRTRNMFKHLKALDVNDPVWLSIPQVSPDAEIQVVFAGDSNTALANAVIKKAAVRPRSKSNTPRAALEQLHQTRDEDRDLLARYVIKDWRGIQDEEGNEVEFSTEHALEFFEALPDWIFDRVRTFCRNPQNFAGTIDDPTDEESRELAGN